jgi:hypothetical protein
VVGNEPNRGDEWGGRPNPAEYAQYLLDVSSALHAAAPRQVLVLNAGLDQYAPHTRGEVLNGLEFYDSAAFLDGMQAANPRVWEAIDIWASHAYPLGPFAQHPGARDFQIDDLASGGPETRTPPWPGLYNRGVNSYRWELYKLSSYGVTRQFKVFITETGWRHTNNQTRSRDRVGAVIGGEQAAAYILLSFNGDGLSAPHEHSWTPWTADADVGAAVLFALAGEPSRWGHTNLLELGHKGDVLGLKPQFAALFNR